MWGHRTRPQGHGDLGQQEDRSPRGWGHGTPGQVLGDMGHEKVRSPEQGQQDIRSPRVWGHRTPGGHVLGDEGTQDTRRSPGTWDTRRAGSRRTGAPGGSVTAQPRRWQLPGRGQGTGTARPGPGGAGVAPDRSGPPASTRTHLRAATAGAPLASCRFPPVPSGPVRSGPRHVPLPPAQQEPKVPRPTGTRPRAPPAAFFLIGRGAAGLPGYGASLKGDWLLWLSYPDTSGLRLLSGRARAEVHLVTGF